MFRVCWWVKKGKDLLCRPRLTLLGGLNYRLQFLEASEFSTALPGEERLAQGS